MAAADRDTTVAAIAAAMHADLCQIYTDVDGVSAPIRASCPPAQKLDEITYDEMLELASLGAQGVLMEPQRGTGKRKYRVNLEVLSSPPGCRERLSGEDTKVKNC